jgi:hypothetical protein
MQAGSPARYANLYEGKADVRRAAEYYRKFIE